MEIVRKTDDAIRVSPAFADCSEAIIFCVNDYYCPYLSVMLYSVLEYISTSRFYDIVILHRDITPENQAIIQKMCDGKQNISIRFVNVAAMIAGYSLYIGGKEDFSVDTYLRLLIPGVLDNIYKKALYLDADMLACSDIGELLNIDLDGFLLASSRDLSGLAAYYSPSSQRRVYRDQILQLDKPDDYFIAGMLVLNLEAFRREYTSEMLLSLAASRKWLQHDQDVLNVICNGGKAKLLHAKWDVMITACADLLPLQYRTEFEESIASPKIIHFGGKDKPWKKTGNPWDDLFWDTVVKTPYYKVIIYRALDGANSRYKTEVDNILKSVTFRVGYTITWLPRKIRGVLKRIHKNDCDF